MDFADLLGSVEKEAVFEPGRLLALDADLERVQRQLARWVKSGRLYHLRRGLYALAPPFQKIQPHPFLVANRLVDGSYVSLRSALAHRGLVPDFIAVTTSITSGRSGVWETPLGRYEFCHIREDLLGDRGRVPLGGGQEAFVASPERALLDLLYLAAPTEIPAYLEELRLQHLGTLDLGELRRQAMGMGKSRLVRAAEHIAHLAETQIEDYELF